MEAEAEAAADSVIKQFGKVDILINNAGIAKFGTHPILSIIRQISLLFEQQEAVPQSKSLTIGQLVLDFKPTNQFM